MLDQFTAFDAIALAILAISAVMGFARGFLRELATLGALVGAIAAAWFARKFFRDDLAALLPKDSFPFAADLILYAVAFIIVYVAVAWFGQNLSRSIQGQDGIGIFDRIAGVFFGLMRGAVALVFFTFLLETGVNESQIPPFVAKSYSFRLLKPAADQLNQQASEAGKDAQEALPKAGDSGQ